MVQRSAEWRKNGKTLGLVPTMGYLHEGHLALVRQARAENDIVIVSIFVNPLQFNQQEDLARYPRNVERDLAMLEAEYVNLVFNPGVEEIYPAGFNAAVEVIGLTEMLEGAARPGHFRGVTTVVAKLFNIVNPQVAYFGQKDAQQVAVIRKMVRDLNFPLKITVCPTRREPDGLAMSSRNVYLTPEERASATVLYRALSAAKTAWESGEREGARLRNVMEQTLAIEPRAQADYVSAAHPDTLQEYAGTIEAGQGVLLSLAVRFGPTRLIDNFLLKA
jgi:pantoate--beta-alanine ligase